MIEFGCTGVAPDAVFDRELGELEREFSRRLKRRRLSSAGARSLLAWFHAELLGIGARCRSRVMH